MTMARRSGKRPTKIHGASPLWAVFWPPVWWIKSGQPKAATPNNVVRRSRKDEREPNRIAGVNRPLARAVRGGTETVTPVPRRQVLRGLHPP